MIDARWESANARNCDLFLERWRQAHVYAELRALEQLDETVAECIGAAVEDGISVDDVEKAAGGSLKEYLRTAIINTSEHARGRPSQRALSSLRAKLLTRVLLGFSQFHASAVRSTPRPRPGVLFSEEEHFRRQSPTPRRASAICRSGGGSSSFCTLDAPPSDRRTERFSPGLTFCRALRDGP